MRPGLILVSALNCSIVRPARSRAAVRSLPMLTAPTVLSTVHTLLMTAPDVGNCRWYDGSRQGQRCSLTGHLVSASMCNAWTTSSLDGLAVRPNRTASDDPVTRRLASATLCVAL